MTDSVLPDGSGISGVPLDDVKSGENDEPSTRQNNPDDDQHSAHSESGSEQDHPGCGCPSTGAACGVEGSDICDCVAGFGTPSAA